MIQIPWLVSLWAITLTNMFSMRSINQRTRKLNISGIVANEKLRLIYVGCFLLASIFDSAAFTFQCLALSEEKGSVAYKRDTIISYYLLSGQSMSILGAHFCMLAMFIKFS